MLHFISLSECIRKCYDYNTNCTGNIHNDDNKVTDKMTNHRVASKIRYQNREKSKKTEKSEKRKGKGNVKKLYLKKPIKPQIAIAIKEMTI